MKSEMDANDSQVLKDAFGIHSLHDKKVVVQALRSGSDCVVVMRTGDGKSVCFLLPCLTSRGVTTVESPLKTISHDKVEKLTDKHIAVVCDGELCREQRRGVLRRGVLSSLRETCDVIKVIYTTPETMLSSRELQRTISVVNKHGRLQRIVYDEDHCVVSCGNTFR
jgi:superfamily II DNA helicase RecQ